MNLPLPAAALATLLLTHALAPAAPTPSSDRPPLPPVLNPDTDTPGLAVGDKAPPATLTSIDGETVELEDLYAQGPVVVVFYRGGWCPYCNKALSAWQDELDELTSAGATLVAISPETAQHGAKTADKADADFLVLCDTTGEAMRRFRVAFTLPEDLQKRYAGFADLERLNATKSWDLPAPATFVVDRAGVIRWVHADWDYKQRAKPADVVDAVRAAKDAAPRR